MQIITLVALMHVILSWLIGYRMISRENAPVNAVYAGIGRVLYPALWPLRLILPNTGDIDGSPVLLIVLALAARYAIRLYPMW